MNTEPAARTVPSNWNGALDPHLRPDLSRSALLVIDMQRDFAEGGAMPVAGTREGIPAVARLLAAYRQARLPIVHVLRLYDGEDVDLLRRAAIAAGADIVRPGTPGSEILPGLLPTGSPPLDPQVLLAGETQELAEGETAIWKPRWSAFHRTALGASLADRDVSSVVIAGCNFPNCPRATLFDATERDLRAVLPTDAISGLEARHIREAEAIGAVHTGSVDLTRRLRRPDGEKRP